MSGINLTNRLDIIADSLYVFDTDGRMNIPLEIKTKSSLDYVNEIKNTLSTNPIITGTLTTDNLVANNDITSKGSLKVDTITSFEAPQININNNVVISGSLTVGTSNIINALGTKANQITTYTKAETNQQIANVVNGSPELLNTLVELSRAINDDENFATTMSTELATKATNTRVNEIRDALQTSINSTNTNLGNNYYNKDVMDLYSTGFQSQINIDTNNLATNYFTKTEVNDIKTILNDEDTSLQNQITADVDNLSTNYFTKTEVTAIQTILNNTDISLQNTDVSLQNQITADVNNLSTNYYNKSNIDDKLILKENISDNNDKLFLKANKTDVYLKEETLTTEQFYVSLQNGLATRQQILLVGSPLNGEALLNSRTIKGVTVNTPLSLTSNSSSIIISSNTYSKEEINTALLLKPDSTNINDALTLKENITANDAKLLLKADKTYVDDKLLLKADITYTDSLNNLKADKTYVDSNLSLKENITDINDKLSFKANKLDVDAALVLKADESNVNTLLNLKSDKSYVETLETNLQNQITTDVNNLSTNYFTKTQVNDIKTILNNTDTSLQNQITADVNNLSTNYYNKTEVNDIKTILNNTDISLQNQITSDVNNLTTNYYNKTEVNDIKTILNNTDTSLQNQITLDVNNLSTNYYNKTYVNTLETNLQNQITTDVNNLSTNYFTKTQVTDIKTILNNTDTSLQNQITADVNNLSTNYYNKTEVNDIKTILNNTDISLQNQITADVNNLANNYHTKTYVNDELATKETILNNNTKLELKSNISYVDTLGTNLTYSINAGALNLSTNYYNKTSIDAIKTGIDVSLSNKADKADTYTKAQVNTIQTNLATSLNNTNDYLNILVDDLDDNYYTKTEINTGYYSKTEIDTTITNLIDSAPTNLDSLKEIATALNNDPNIYSTIQTQLTGKQNKFILGELPLTNSARLFDLNSTKFRGIHCSNPLSIVQTNDAYLTLDADCYTKSQTDTLINVKSDNSYTDSQLLLKENIIDNDIKLSYKENITNNNTKLSNKQNKFLLGELPATNSGRLFDLNSTKFRGIHCSNPLSIVETNDAYLTLDVDCYTKAQTDNLISTISLTPGTDGTNGTNGTNGIDGINGTNGLKGDKGTDGTNGTNGTNGIDGINGTNGLKGDKGVDGTNGINGTNGTNGLKGDKGTDGTNGTNGLDGINGTNGLKGDKGTDGTNGINGTNGTNGIDGLNGTNGTNGLKGNQGDTGPAGIYTSGTSSLDSQAIISESVIKNLKPGTAITLTSDDNSIIISTRDAYTKTETDTQLALKSNITNPTFIGNLTVPQIICDTNYGSPSFNTRSIGNKIVLYPNISATTLDYAIGVESGSMFFTTPYSTSGFRFYNGLTFPTSITGGGNIETAGSISSASLSTTANVSVGGDLTVGSTNIINELNNKLSNTDTKLTNTAVAWSSGLVDDVDHILSTGTNSLIIRSKTGTPIDIIKVLNTGNVMFNGGVENLTFNDNGGAPYTLQDAFDFKQNSITAYTPTSSTQLFSQGADSGYMKALKAGTGITLSADGTSVTVNGIDGYTKTEVNNSLALKANAASPVFTGNASVGGVLSVTGNSNLTGDLSVTRTAATGNGNVAITATNNGNEGFSSLYLQTRNQISPMTNETAQIFVGQNSGMFLHTRTSHPITFQTYTEQPSTTVTPSMKILGSGTRDVEIYTPLKINSTQTTFSGGAQNITFNNNGGTPSTLQAALTLKANASDVYTRTQTAATFQMKIDAFSAPLKFVVGPLVSTLSIDASSGVTLSDATITNSLTVGSLVVTGNLTVTGDGPWFCAGRVSSGGTGSIMSNYGRVGFTLVRNGLGQVTITMNSAHPQGANYAVFASSSRAFTVVENNSSGAGIRTSTSFQISVRNSDFSTGSDTNGITFMVV